MPTLNEEKRLWEKGYKLVACLDEAGRGPLAGPVVAGAVVVRAGKLIFGRFNLPHNFGGGRTFRYQSFRDSKKLSHKKREEFYKIIIKHPAIAWGVGIVSEKVIDKINILEATKLAMVKALDDLSKRLPHFSHDRRKSEEVSFLILDGRMELDLNIPQKSIVKADEKVFSCAAASIIAKVTRDKIMMRYHKKYPRYRFDLHKGYGTKLHFDTLKKYGTCKIHRQSFYPVYMVGYCQIHRKYL